MAANSDNDATKIIFQKSPGPQDTVMRPDRTTQTAGGGIPPFPVDVPPPPQAGATVFVPFGGSPAASVEPDYNPVVGWLVVVDGPGKGKFRPVFYGQNAIGRNADMKIVLDFGDPGISRDAHAFLIYDEVERRFFVKDNGQSNLVRLNGAVVLKPTELNDRDRLTIGQTTVLFVALCDQRFDWLAEHAPQAT